MSPPESCSPVVLRVDQLAVRYAQQVALRSVSLQLHQGEFGVVLGVSGAGKSTLLRAINGLQTPTSGRVDLPAVESPQNGRSPRQVGMIFQQHQLLPRQSALTNVLMGRLGYHSFWRSLWPLPQADQAIALHCLARVNLLDYALTPVSQLSGGQQQRVGIARALAQQPDILLADEPIASLDPVSAHQVMTLLRDICRTDGITALLSLHQVDFAKTYGDRIIGLSHGQVVFDDVPTKLTDERLRGIYAGAIGHPDS